MKRLFQLFAVVLIAPLVVFAGVPAHAENCQKRVERPFMVFNSLFFDGQPDMSKYGMRPIYVVDRDIWAPSVPRTGPADLGAVKKYLGRIPPDGPVVLDFEDYDLTQDDAQAAAGTRNLIQKMETFRKAGRGRKFGFYGYVPLVDYWRVVGSPKGEPFLSWQRDNDRSGRELERVVDAVYPSLYTFYADRDQWVTYATAQICEARRLSSKPVYVFIWPHYHPNGAAKSAPRAIDGDYWRLQLETARRLADGVVIWGGWNDQTNSRAGWDDNAPWWAETIEFMRGLDSR